MLRSIFWQLLIAAVCCSASLAQTKSSKAPVVPVSAGIKLPPGVKRIPAPKDAVAVALEDCLRESRDRQPYCWYIWDSIGTAESTGCTSWTVNCTISQNARIIDPIIVQAKDETGKPIGPKVLKWYLNQLCPKTKEPDGSYSFRNLNKVWDVFQELAEFEWVFHQPSATGKQIRYSTKWVLEPCEAYVHPKDGQTYTQKWVEKQIEIVDLRKFEFSVGAGGAGNLQLLSELTDGNLMPICRFDWFIATALTSVNIEGIHGRYYQLSGIEKSKVPGQSDFEAFLIQFGADPKLPDDKKQKSVQTSGVTGLWRTTEAQLTLGVRPEDAPGIITITHDIQDDQDGEDFHGLLNLVDVKFQGQEIIAPGPNALYRFLATDGQGKRVDEVPFNIASWDADWSKAPWKRKRLIVGASCIGCHAPGGGLNDLRNVVLKNDQKGFSPFFQLRKKGGKVVNEGTEEILRTQFLGDIESAVRQSRLSYARKINEVTGGVFAPKGNEKDETVKKASEKLLQYYASYWRVSQVSVLAELGYEVDPELAPVVLELMFGKQDDDDVRIRTLMNGEQILRTDVQQTFFEMLIRDRLRFPDKVISRRESQDKLGSAKTRQGNVKSKLAL